MAEHNLGVQGAIDFVAQMLADRVREYAELKTRVPSFGSDVDAMLAKYHEACENFVQAAAVWYSSSRRALQLNLFLLTLSDLFFRRVLPRGCSLI